MRLVTVTDGEKAEHEVHPLGAFAGLRFDELVLTWKDLAAMRKLPPERLHELVDCLYMHAR